VKKKSVLVQMQAFLLWAFLLFGSMAASTQIPLRGVREARGWGLRGTARKADIDPAHLSRIERGLAVPSVQVLHRLALVLELPELARFLAPYDQPEAADHPSPRTPR
jgi:hypothetical protein